MKTIREKVGHCYVANDLELPEKTPGREVFRNCTFMNSISDVVCLFPQDTSRSKLENAECLPPS